MKTFPSHVAFLGIDPQLTFCEDGGLAVSGGHQIMPKLNELRSKSTKGYWTQDWRLKGPMMPEVLHALQEAYDEIDKLEKALSILNSTHFPKE